MSRSMWKCSGKHWLGQAAVWSVFAASIALAAGPETGEPQDAAVKFAVPHAATSAQVSIKIQNFDLTDLTPEHFGDHAAAQAVR